jgi:CubicO group peptidase (beta-lactamase class C family)
MFTEELMKAELPRSAPEAQGIPSSAILAFVDAADRTVEHLHSLMLLRHGQVVAEGWWAPYEPDQVHMLFSLSKSFTSTAIGLAVAEGRLSVDDPVLQFFPDDAPAQPSEHLAAMRVRHLLAMCTGHVVDTTPALHQSPDGNWAKAFLACPVERAPGTHFLYNTGATYMLSAIIQHLTGVTLLEYLRPRLLEPLGIGEARWDTCPRGINTGGFGMWVTTDAIARFGQLYLQRGQWQGRQLVPAEWVDAATTSQIDNAPNDNPDWAQGYGYQFWRCRHGGYRGDGAFGQFCVVLPEQDTVVAITSGLDAMQPVLDLVWQHILPALGPAPLPANPAAQAALADRLGGLALPLPPGRASSPTAARVSGRTYTFEPNGLEFESLALTFDAGGCTAAIHSSGGEHQILVGQGEWRPGITSFVDRGPPAPAAAAGAWADDETYVIKMHYSETPFCATLSCRFAGERLLLDFGLNVSFGPTKFPTVVGYLR